MPPLAWTGPETVEPETVSPEPAWRRKALPEWVTWAAARRPKTCPAPKRLAAVEPCPPAERLEGSVAAVEREP